MAAITLHKEKDCRFVAVSHTFLNDYMPGANGEFVKVYLCVLQAFQQEDASFSTDVLADRLSCTEGDILRALHYWQTQGLLALTTTNGQILSLALTDPSPAGPLKEAASTCEPEKSKPEPGFTEPAAQSQKPGFQEPAAQPQELPKPEPLSRERLAQLKSDEEFAQLLYIVESYLGKPLTPAEISSLDYYYEVLHFPTELIEYLVEYCVSKGHKSFRYIESVALGWHSDGILTVEQARQQSSQYTRQYYSVLKAFGITDRSPVDQEIRTIDHWMKDLGFDTDMICEACSRTVKTIGKASFAYADGILSRWKGQNVRTRKDIEAADALHENRKNVQKQAQSRSKENNSTAKASRSRFNNFEQRSYDYQKLEQQLLSAGKKE